MESPVALKLGVAPTRRELESLPYVSEQPAEEKNNLMLTSAAARNILLVLRAGYGS